MAVVEELLRKEEDGSISFGNHKLDAKAKVEDFEHRGDLYKVKTFKTMTKLERNGMFVYESVPGTSVLNFEETEDGIRFLVEGNGDAQITVQLAESAEYEVFVAGASIGKMKTNLAGKLNISVELEGAGETEVRIAAQQ
ncbi:MAG: endosialidase [Lachnospiraceae bacterium]|nr:endosialidase [Lachnospiraceae bacterium]